jgi:cytosine permease
VPLLLVVIAVPAALALSTHPLGQIWLAAPKETPYSWGTVVSLVTGGHMVAVATTPDITRFVRNRRETVTGMIVGYGVALPVLVLVAAALAGVYGNSDLVDIMIRSGVGAPALLGIALATWTANDKNLYESSLSMSTLMPRVPRWQLAVLAAVIGTGLAAAGIFSHFIMVLALMGVLIAPMAGVYLVDHLIDPERYNREEPPVLRWHTFAAWLAGSALGFMTLPPDQGGLGWFTLTTASTLDALIVAAAAQALLGSGWLGLGESAASELPGDKA